LGLIEALIEANQSTVGRKLKGDVNHWRNGVKATPGNENELFNGWLARLD
jgi:hypothetical protein